MKTIPFAKTIDNNTIHGIIKIHEKSNTITCVKYIFNLDNNKEYIINDNSNVHNMDSIENIIRRYLLNYINSNNIETNTILIKITSQLFSKYIYDIINEIRILKNN